MSALLTLFLVGIEAPIQQREPSHAEMEHALRQCGLKQLTIFRAEITEDDVVKIADPEVSDEQIWCAFRARDHTGYYLEWSEEVQPRYVSIARSVLEPRYIAKAEAYFSERRMPEPLPVRTQEQTDLSFARDLERFCGANASGLFSKLEGDLVIDMDRIQSDEAEAAVECLDHAATLTKLTYYSVETLTTVESVAADP